MEKLKLNTCYFNIVAFRLTKVLVINASKEGITTFLARYGKYEIPPQIIPIQDLYCQERFWYPKEVIQNPNVTPSDPTPYCALKAHGPHRIPQLLHIRFITDTNDSLIFSPSITEHGFTDEKVTLTMNLQGWKQFLKMLTHLHDNSTWFYVTIPQPSWKHLPFQLTAPDKNYPNEIIFNAIECIRLDPEDKVFFIANAFQENLKAPIYVRVLGTPSGLLWLANWITTFIKSTKEEEYFHNTWIIPPIDRDTTYAEHSIYLKKVTSHEKHPILSFEYKNEDLNTLYIFGNEEGLKGLVYEIWGYAFDKDDDSFCRTSSNFTGGDFVPQTLGGLDFHPFQSWKILGGMYFTEKYDPLNRSRYSLGITLEEYDSWEKEVLRRYVNERIVLP